MIQSPFTTFVLKDTFWISVGSFRSIVASGLFLGNPANGRSCNYYLHVSRLQYLCPVENVSFAGLLFQGDGLHRRFIEEDIF